MTKTQRATIRAHLAASREYDAATMRISATGEVTALKDADKTYAGNDSTRYFVGYSEELLTRGFA